jgi:proline iminopeptidase
MQRLLATLLLLSGSALAQQAPADTGIVPTPEVDLAYESYDTAGNATPVIVANGGPGLSHIYMLQNDVWTRLSHHRQIVFYDQRGTGKSKNVKPGASWGMDAQVADMEAVRAKFGFQKFDLVGDSYGGLLAMAYAAPHPEHIEKLILSDSAAPAWKDIVRVLPDVFPDVLEQVAAREKSSAGNPNAADQHIRDHFLMLFYSEANRDAYLAGVKDLESVPQVSAAVQKATRTLDLTPELSKFKFPTMVITGRYDMNVTPVTAWNIYKAIPESKFVVFERSGHLPSYEEPDKYVQVVDAFLSQP